MAMPAPSLQALVPQSRLAMELQAIGRWGDAAELRGHAQLLVDAIPRPPTDEDTILALSAVQAFLSLTEDAAAPESGETKGVAVAALAANRILKELLAAAHLAGAPLAAKLYNEDHGNIEAFAHLQQLQPLQPAAAPGEPDMVELGQRGGPHVLLHLVSVQHFASKVVHKSVRDIPYVSCSLTEDMAKDRHDHQVFFATVPRVPDVYGRLFQGQRGDFKSLWSEHVNVAGRMTHPARIGAELPGFDADLWQGSVISGREILSHGAPTPDHPLPDADALRFCFKSHEAKAATGSKRAKSGSQDTFYLETDTFSALSLLCGDLVYRFSLHLGDFLPDLAPGTRMAIPSRKLHQSVLTLGLWFQLCINYQSYCLSSTFTPFELHEIHHSLGFPIRDHPDCRKLVTFSYAHKDLGPKRLAALPYLLTSRGLRGFHTFLADPDLYLAKVDSPTAKFIDEITGLISEARTRVTARQKQPNVNSTNSAAISLLGQPNHPQQAQNGLSFVSMI